MPAPARLRLLVVLVVGCIVLGGLFALGRTEGPASLKGAGDTSPSGGTARAQQRSGSDGSTTDTGGDRTATQKRKSETINTASGSATKGLPGITAKAKGGGGALISRPLPKTASGRGMVVAGFPAGVIPLASASSVQSSGISSAGTKMQVSIVATSSRSPDRILLFYRTALARSGFVESAAPAVGGSTAASFAHEADNLVVTVTRTSPKASTYSVYGTLHTGGRQ